MSTFKPEQRRVEVDGRELHFVAYEGRPAHAGRGEEAEPPMWYLMCEGHRRQVMPHVAGQPAEEVTAALLSWLAEHTDGAPPAKAPRRRVRQDVE